MAAKKWELDFRFPAIEASMELIRNGRLDDPFQSPFSFCIPVNHRPAVGWTPGKITLIFLILGFAGLGGGAWLASIAEKNGQANAGLLALGVCLSLSGMAAFFVPTKFDRFIIRWILGERGKQLLEQAGASQTSTAEISNPDPSQMMKISIDGDDHVLIYFDKENHRVVMEGTAARYQIRAEDVELLEPFEFMNYVGVQIGFRIENKAHLQLAVARVSIVAEIIRQVPILFFLKRFIPRKLYHRFTDVLSPTRTCSGS